MISVATLILVQTMLQTTAILAERRYRQRILIKWLRGELTIEQLHWLKRQLWFQKAFPLAIATTEKKNV